MRGFTNILDQGHLLLATFSNILTNALIQHQQLYNLIGFTKYPGSTKSSPGYIFQHSN